MLPRSAAERKVACLLSSAVRYVFREDIASPSGSRMIGHHPDLDPKIQITGHSLNDESLLIVFLTEISNVWENQMEELANHEGDTRKMPGAAGSAEVFRKVFNTYGG